MEDIPASLENKINEVINDVLKPDPIQNVFYKYAAVSQFDDIGPKGVEKMCNKFKAIFEEESNKPDIPSAQTNVQGAESVPKNVEQRDCSPIQEYAIKLLVNDMATRKNLEKAKFVGSVLIKLATLKLVPAKIICFSLMTHENLILDNATFWMLTFNLVQSIISLVDYKGVREIMKCCLERARLLPYYLKRSQICQSEALKNLITLIFDRDASLLPGYFIVTELLKFFPNYKGFPHWELSTLLITFIGKFRRSAQLLSIIGRDHYRPIVEHSGNTSPSINSWKLNCATLKFPLKGALPYAEYLQKPQSDLLKYVFRQNCSKEMIMTMLDLQKKQVYSTLEEHMVDLLIESMGECAQSDKNYRPPKRPEELPGSSGSNEGEETSPAPAESTTTVEIVQGCQCCYVSSLLIYFVLNQLIVFKSLVQALHEKLQKRKDIHSGRDHLMWALLQFLSGTITKNPVSDFQPVLRLIELLYPDQTPMPVPDFYDPRSAFQLSAMCILIHILRKAQTDNLKTPQSLPPAFTIHHELLQNLVHNPSVPLLTSSGFPTSPNSDYRIALLLNAYSTNQEVFHRPVYALMEVIQGSSRSTVSMPGTNCVALGSTVPFTMSFLDGLTIHVKMSIIHNISSHINKHSMNKSTVALAPALVETYARLLVYSETESLGLKQCIHQLLPVIYKNQTWGIFHTLLEMFTYRIHHSPPNYRIHLLSTIHHMSVGLNNLPNMNQLHLCMENCALRLITGLGNNEVIPNLTRFFSTDSKANVFSTESEELNRVLVLTLARAIHITGCDISPETSRWCVDFLKAVMAQTPHTWASHTLQSFPPVIADFYRQYGASKDTVNLKKAVEDEFVKWKSMNSESDFLAHFPLQQNTSNLFLCLLFKMVFETSRVPTEAYKILERLGPRQLMAHVRTLCDFLVLEFSNSSLGHHLSKCVDTMKAIVWQYNIIPIDRLILCLVLRTQEGSSEAQVLLFIIQLLLLRPQEFRSRIYDFATENSPEHWKQNNWYEKHMVFHRKYPENFAPVTMRDGQGSLSSQQQTLPIYFTNVCLRFLPVLDIMLHRFLEVVPVHKRLDSLLDNLGAIYKFHDRPITYLYNTLHYYEDKLRDSLMLKKQLVGTVIMSQKDFRPNGWALTEDYIKYLNIPAEDKAVWVPDTKYFVNMVERMVKTINDGNSVFSNIEWRFNEFANVNDHAIHVTCVELMALPLPPATVGNMIISTLTESKYYTLYPNEIMQWINVIGLILAYLPDAYSSVINDMVINILQVRDLTEPDEISLDPFLMMNLEKLLPAMIAVMPAIKAGIIHSFWNHAPVCQVAKVVTLIRDKINPILKTEEQYIVLLQLVAPFMLRLNSEVSRKVFDLTVELAQALATVDGHVAELKYQDHICDTFYHIKYMFTGDKTKAALEDIIRTLRSCLQLRLRFVTHLNVEEIESGITSNANIPATNGRTTPNTASDTQIPVASGIGTSVTINAVNGSGLSNPPSSL